MPGHYTATDLYEEFGRPGMVGREALLRHIQGKTRNEAAALDIESALWFRASQHEQGWAARAPGKSWLYTVANNLVIDYIRGCRTDPLAQSALALDADREDEGGEWQDSIEPVYSGESPQELVSYAEETAKVSALLMLIEPAYRAVLVRRADGQTLSEIAEGMNLPLATVKARFYRGRTKLSEAMQKLEATW
jgi:RNA polymerase sigma factor (sigma-70 family)